MREKTTSQYRVENSDIQRNPKLDVWYGAVAVGHEAICIGTYGIALGSEARCNSSYGIVIGRNM